MYKRIDYTWQNFEKECRYDQITKKSWEIVSIRQKKIKPMLKGSTKDLELTLVERLSLSGQAEWLLGGGELGLPGMAIYSSKSL